MDYLTLLREFKKHQRRELGFLERINGRAELSPAEFKEFLALLYERRKYRALLRNARATYEEKEILGKEIEEVLRTEGLLRLRFEGLKEKLVAQIGAASKNQKAFSQYHRFRKRFFT